MQQGHMAARRVAAVLVGLTPAAWLVWAAAAWSGDAPLSSVAAATVAAVTTLLAISTALAVLSDETP